MSNVDLSVEDVVTGQLGSLLVQPRMSHVAPISPSSSRPSATLTDLPDDALVHILLFLNPMHCDLQSPEVFNEMIMPHSSLNTSLSAQFYIFHFRSTKQILRWPREALTIALTCKQMYHLLFLNPTNDALFWRWHCFVFLTSIVSHDRFTDPMHAYYFDLTPSQRRVVNRDRARFYIPEDQRHIAPVGSQEQRSQPNYYRLLTARHHKRHEELCQDLQRRADARYRGERVVKGLRKPALITYVTALYISCLLFYILQTLRGLLHWLLVDILQFSWYELPSRIFLHVSWLPAWFVVILLFTLSTLVALHYSINRNEDLVLNLGATCLVKIVFAAVFLTLLLLYLANVLPKRTGDPAWLQSEYIPWSVAVAPLLLILLGTAGMCDSPAAKSTTMSCNSTTITTTITMCLSLQYLSNYAADAALGIFFSIRKHRDRFTRL